MGFDLQHSTADSLLNAHHGYQVALHVEQAGRFLPGTFNYYALAIDGRQYLPIGDKVVFASRLLLGNIRPDDNDPGNVPFSKKYFLGGATSLRGWGRYEVSPLSDSGLPIGGNSMVSFSEELRAELRGKLGGVLFLDAGNVWADSWGIDFGDLALRGRPRSAVSDAGRADPLRLRVPAQSDPRAPRRRRAAARRWRIHFSIGQAF